MAIFVSSGENELFKKKKNDNLRPITSVRKGIRTNYFTYVCNTSLVIRSFHKIDDY